MSLLSRLAGDKEPELPKDKTRAGFAVVGLGQLAVEEILPAFAKSDRAKLVALVSGDRAKAEHLARVYGLGPDSLYDYQDFDRIRDNPAVDIVYVVLPNTMHAEFTVRALNARKHVLCEKPMAPTLADCERMIRTAKERDRKLMIAYRLHYEPLTRKAAKLIADREFGALKLINASHCQTTTAPDIRLRKDLDGGPLGDVGIYCLNAARMLAGEEPEAVSGAAFQPKNNSDFDEVPESVVFTLRFPSGVLAQCECSFGTVRVDRFHALCAEGSVEMDPAFGYWGLRLLARKAGEAGVTASETEHLERPVDQFAAEMDHMAECVLDGGTPRTPGATGLEDMRTILAIEEAIRTGRWVTIPR